MIMLTWKTITRFPALSHISKDPLRTLPKVGGRGQDMERLLPDNVNWKSHNYSHLMEQPTIFYAVVFVLALAGAGTGLNLMLAWAYVGLRIAHSIWQATRNNIPVRIGLSLVSSFCLYALAFNAVALTLLE
jgi:hypothetical protein